jgi:tRNA A-37 threonylcarbamoyl transferase component Bud32
LGFDAQEITHINWRMWLKRHLESEGENFRKFEGAFIGSYAKSASQGKKMQKIVKNLQKQFRFEPVLNSE